mgnify:CR=1 FL=1
MAVVGKCQHNTYGTPQRIKFLENGKCRNAVLYKCLMPYCPIVFHIMERSLQHHRIASGCRVPVPPLTSLLKGELA